MSAPHNYRPSQLCNGSRRALSSFMEDLDGLISEKRSDCLCKPARTHSEVFCRILPEADSVPFAYGIQFSIALDERGPFHLQPAEFPGVALFEPEVQEFMPEQELHSLP
jgi:hypothetical protein